MSFNAYANLELSLQRSKVNMSSLTQYFNIIGSNPAKVHGKSAKKVFIEKSSTINKDKPFKKVQNPDI
jgi:hypothetical protein